MKMNVNIPGENCSISRYLVQPILLLAVMSLDLVVAGFCTAAEAREDNPGGLQIENGWFVHKGRVVWGYGQHNAWWKPEEGANITRRDPGGMKPNRMEDLDKLTENMLRYGYPGFEHNYGLWYDRRRDVHDTVRRMDANVQSPFLEQPWARSETGTAWDGLTKYDLTKYNAWYFDRIKEFASISQRKGTILFHNFYMQHALLEADTHYVDFPWREVNSLQATQMPDRVPAANAFYDISNPLRRELHRAYIRKCLDEIGGYQNVVYLLSQEYTGGIDFMRFWLDVVTEWQRERNQRLILGLGGTKDVLDALADDERFSVLDLRYWWYNPDGSVTAPLSGKQIAGRYAMGKHCATNTPAAIYRQVREYRLKYPKKALLHQINASRQQVWAFLMGGGSMLIRFLPYPNNTNPPEYIAPEATVTIQTTYDLINKHLSTTLQRMIPMDVVLSEQEEKWCLGEAGKCYLVYALYGGSIRLDLSDTQGFFSVRWFDPRTGGLREDSAQPRVEAGKEVIFNAPGREDWVLWLTALPMDQNGHTHASRSPESNAQPK